jgi:hypothetical protein
LLTKGKQAAILITPSSWGFQLTGYLLHQIGSINDVDGFEEESDKEGEW